LTQAEVARRLGLSPKTVEKQVAAGLRRLAAMLGEPS
jgi:DNA-binding CsgD family transcriptional regulator